MNRIFTLVIGLLFLTSLAYCSPSNSISIPNPAVANTVIQSSSYNSNNNEIQSKYDAHTHTDVTSVGAITSGSWLATPVATQYGGTGQDLSAATQGTILYFSGTGTLAKLVASASGLSLITKSDSKNPVWEKISLTNSVLGVLGLTNGGTATTGGNLVKGWVAFNGVGAIAITDSYNVSSIARTGGGLAAGDYTITWDTDFANTNYCVIATVGGTEATAAAAPAVISKAVGSCRIQCGQDGVTWGMDFSIVSVMAIGAQ